MKEGGSINKGLLQPISPLKYDPDDPSTFPPSETDESAVKQRSKPSKDKEKKNKSAEKKAQKSTLNALKSSPFSSRLPPMMNLREANDMETVNDMVSAWGAVQVQEQDPPNKDNKIRSEMQPPK
ncbi:hypothetical protein Y032_0042g532 [Ancylostoma ceylanicum]|uniref:Uncharacterized protein n=1 Tax=Ancylostoma ceylanicum TaxID=53326 RepID=A0A016UFU8_9BILA|nr:hypothetical protein Y032_0042g532 [Ancylostoma ceylanicum]